MLLLSTLVLLLLMMRMETRLNKKLNQVKHSTLTNTDIDCVSARIAAVDRKLAKFEKVLHPLVVIKKK